VFQKSNPWYHGKCRKQPIIVRCSSKVIGIPSDPIHHILLMCKKGQKETPFIDNSIFPLYYIHTFTGVNMSPVKHKKIHKMIPPPEADALADSFAKAARSVLAQTGELTGVAADLESGCQGEQKNRLMDSFRR
jgi:hypothetical protein